MKYTLLEMTQNILSDMSSDEVDSINDTTESLQVANIIQETYYYLISGEILPEHKGLFQLTETDASTPVQMSLPDGVMTLDWLRYDKKASGETNIKFEDIYYLDWTDFYDRQNQLNTDDSTTSSFSVTDGDYTFTLKYQTDRHPTYWTSFDDDTILFDSLDTDIDTYLTATKSLSYGQLENTFTLTDAFTPSLDEKDFNWLLNEAKAACSVKLRQVEDPIAKKRARRGWITKEIRQERIPDGLTAYSKYNNFGRRPR